MTRSLVTGGTGMIGRYLVELLLALGDEVVVASLDGPELCNPNAEFKHLDLRDFTNCLSVSKNIDHVYHLAGVKGSPKMCRDQPADFFVPTITFNVNMMEAARRNSVQKYLYTSSIGVYQPAEVFKEDDVWETFPSEHDRFAGWAKRMGELQAAAYQKQYKDSGPVYSIIRPGNVYGRYDNFDPDTGMVIPSLIARTYQKESPLLVWGDGKPVRDFIHASDVASAMQFALDNSITKPLNVSSGEPTNIEKLVKIISQSFGNHPYKFTQEGASGDNKRLMDVSRISSYGWKPKINLLTGIQDTIDWFIETGHKGYNRYNSFKEIDL